MSEREKSRYETAKKLERAKGLKVAQQSTNAVRFHSHVFATGECKDSGETVIRFMVHEDQAVEIALSPAMASRLGATLFARGGAK